MKLLVILCGLLLCYACQPQNRNTQPRTRSITDALGRKVVLQDSIQRIVCIRASAIRLVTYAGGVPFICGVEEQECRPNEYTHILAHPELARKPIIGPSMGGDAELILTVCPDVIFMSATTVEDADALQTRTNIPVFTIEYGDLHRNRPCFYQSLRKIAQVLHTERHTDSLIRFIDEQIAELRQRTTSSTHAPKTYVGGISYRGQKGITSTDPYYAAFQFIGADNVASCIDSTYISPINGTYIDREQLFEWDPEIIFIDTGGLPLDKEDLRKQKKLNSLLSAYRNRRIYTLWPYNNHHANFEIMLINAWYAGKILYPEQFLDISIPDKADEILTRFVGHPITEQLTHHWGNYRNLFNKIH